MLSRLACLFKGHDWTEQPLRLHRVGFPARDCGRCGAHEDESGPMLSFPARYKYTCYGCGGPLSAENAGAGLDCGLCQEFQSREGRSE
jgi:hypothetical protein